MCLISDKITEKHAAGERRKWSWRKDLMSLSTEHFKLQSVLSTKHSAWSSLSMKHDGNERSQRRCKSTHRLSFKHMHTAEDGGTGILLSMSHPENCWTIKYAECNRDRAKTAKRPASLIDILFSLPYIDCCQNSLPPHLFQSWTSWIRVTEFELLFQVFLF